MYVVVLEGVCKKALHTSNHRTCNCSTAAMTNRTDMQAGKGVGV